ncbi:MAG TPA: 2-C-methyl-D-erythritol 4-phosphate cytidylyltransferase, partial [Methylomirabilota bacterium]|nr:2-C-methyl-D-erythritol 4-phosphate cytidylyltransferase [Methylomirabilota bacterium]
MARIAVLVPAGGLGTRIGSRTPKQFLHLSGLPILALTVRHFVSHPDVRAIVIAAPEAHVARARAVLPMSRRAALAVVAGGATRQESVWRALQVVPADTEVVVVHDAVRPFISRALIDAVVAGALADGAAICALPIAETVKRVRDGIVQATVDREGLWAVQTPQAFRLATLREAHDKARRDGIVGTDEAMLVERLGHAVRVVPGNADNVKITTPEDLRRARRR